MAKEDAKAISNCSRVEIVIAGDFNSTPALQREFIRQKAISTLHDVDAMRSGAI